MSKKILDIAIVGISCKFAGANNVQELWKNLKNGVESVKPIPNERWEQEEYFSGKKGEKGKIYCPTGAFIDDVYSFDKEYYGMSDIEARLLDPQQKILLELTKDVFIDAGYGKNDYYGKDIGVFIAASESGSIELHSMYSRFCQLDKELKKVMEEKFGSTIWDANIMPTSLINLLSGRISHEYNLKGPSMVIDTACSSSLVALHEACHSLIRGECSSVICGGVYLLLTPSAYYAFSAAEALSSSGKLSAFDENADGFVPGEGAALIYLKKLEQALIDNDHIYAVIKGSVVNNDGHSIGVMTPNPSGQREVIQKFYQEMSVSPTEISYMEAHGTGTKIGDISEFRSLSQAFGRWKIEKNSIALGSIKANIGHTIAASGMAGILKIIGMMQEGCIYPQINLLNPSHTLKMDNSPFYFQNNLTQVVKNSMEYAAINSFGFGGTNAHVIIENGKKHKKDCKKKKLLSYMYVVGGHNKESFDKNKTFLLKQIKENKFDFHDFMMNQMRLYSEYAFIQSGEVKDQNELIEKITTMQGSYKKACNIAMLFTGQGSQYFGMGKALYDNIPLFRIIFDECAELFKIYISEDIRKILFEGDKKKKIIATEIVQPVVFSIDYTLGKILLNANVKPKVMLGHSIGEWVAMVLADVITLEEAVEIVSYRAKLMAQQNGKGKMIAVFGKSVEQLQDIIKKNHVNISGDNISHIVIGGSNKNIKDFINELNAKKITYSELEVSSAFHTDMFQEIGVKFALFLKKFNFRNPKITIIGNVTAQEMQIYTPQYLGEHICRTVRFRESMELVKEIGVTHLIECGGINTLINMSKTITSFIGISFLTPKNIEGISSFIEGLSKVLLCSKTFDLYKIFQGIQYNKISLPQYGFIQKPYSIFKSYDNMSWINKWFWEEIDTLKLNRIENSIYVLWDKYSIFNKKEYISYIDNCINNKCTLKSESEYTIIYELGNPGVEWEYEKNEKIYFSYSMELLKLLKKYDNQIFHLLILIKDIEDSVDINNSYSFACSAATFIQSLANQVLNIYDTSVFITNGNSDDIYLYQKNMWCKKIGKNYYIRKMCRYKATKDKEIEGNGAVIIIGGAGSIGLNIAEEFIKSSRYSVILVGRRKKDDNIETNINNITKDRKLLNYYSCDIAEIDKVNELLKFIINEYGQIYQIYHLAGNLSKNVICTLESKFEDMLDVFRSKILGLINISKVIEKENIKISRLILFSSVSASEIKWGKGLADYAAANAFLDYFVQKTSLPAIAFNYTLWELDDGIDSKLDMNNKDSALASSGLSVIPKKDAINILFKMMKKPENNVVYHIYKEKKTEHTEYSKEKKIKKEIKTQDIKNKIEIQKENLKETLYKLIEVYTESKIVKDNEEDNFVSLGLNSLTALKLIDEINKILGTELYPTIIYEYQSPIELYDYIFQIISSNKNENINNKKIKDSENRQINNSLHTDIAIVGLSIETAGAKNVEEFWDILQKGKCCIDAIPSDHFVSFDKNKNYRGGFIEDVYEFDPLFFGISPVEAKCVDPQQRRFLEHTYKALMQAGYINTLAPKDIGVYVGTEQNNYSEQFSNERLYKRIQGIIEKKEDLGKIQEVLYTSIMSSDAVTGNSLNQIATRISYTFGFTGPSLILNTACSSSLVALSYACTDLRSNNISAAVVGGVNLNLSDIPYEGLGKLHALSPNGECLPFDDKATGMMLGEAVVSIVVKRMEDAIKDGNYIYGLIKDVAVNNNGYAQGVTVPTVNGQQAVIEEINERYTKECRNVKYIETHGTGTPLGDPIEVSSIVNAYRDILEDTCYLGSYKGNFGHPLAASGLVSIVKIMKIFEKNKYLQLLILILKILN